MFCPRCFSVDDDLVLTSSAAFVTFADHALRLMPSGISLISQFRHTNDNETHQLLVKRVNLHTYFPFECKAFNVQFLFVLFYFTGTRFNVCGSCCWSGLWTGPWWPSLWRCTPCGEPKKKQKMTGAAKDGRRAKARTSPQVFDFLDYPKVATWCHTRSEHGANGLKWRRIFTSWKTCRPVPGKSNYASVP